MRDFLFFWIVLSAASWLLVLLSGDDGFSLPFLMESFGNSLSYMLPFAAVTSLLTVFLRKRA